MRDDTHIGGPRDRFPRTRHSLVAAIRDDDASVRREAYDLLIASYWKPVYKYVRLKWRADNEEAKDLTQGFFANALSRPSLERYEASRSAFRTWVRTCVDGFVANERKAGGRLKRGGGARRVPLDFEEAEAELRHQAPRRDADPDAIFRQEWLRSLIAGAVDDLREQSEAAGRGIDFAIFERYDLQRDGDSATTYAAVAAALDVPSTKVTNALHAMRGRFRTTVLDHLRRVCASDGEFRAEAREIFGERRP